MYKIIFLFLLLINSLAANKVYIITNENISASKEELQRFFFAKSDYIDGKKYKRVSNKEAIELFAKLAFSLTKKKLSKKWMKQNFRKGIPFPISIKNDKKMIRWVKNHPKSIGFTTSIDDSVHVIYVYEED